MKDIINQPTDCVSDQILKFRNTLLSEAVPHWYIEKSNKTIGIAWYDNNIQIYSQKGIILAFIKYEYEHNLQGYDLQVLENCDNYFNFSTFQSNKIYHSVFCIENIDEYSWLHNYLTLIAQNPISPLYAEHEIKELKKNNIQIFSTPDNLHLSKNSVFSYINNELKILK